jgi:hypothetical protein
MDWQMELQLEFERAEKANASGNAGQARVCARRAAGIAIREYFSRRGRVLGTPSAYDLIKLAEDDSSLGPQARQSAAYLALRVNEDFKLPVNVDLIREAEKLCSALLEEGR